MKAKYLPGLVVTGNLTIALVFYWVSIPYGLDGLCKCCCGVLIFPLGWLGAFAARLLGAWGRVGYFSFLWGGAILNACLWGWIVARVLRAIERSATNPGFDASVIAPQIERLRHGHALAAHARVKPQTFRKGLVTTAANTLARLAYFSTGRAADNHSVEEGPKQES